MAKKENKNKEIPSEGGALEQYILRNTRGIQVRIIPYGGRIVSLKIPDRNGIFENVVLGFDDLENYLEDNPYFGAIVGRYGNRIANGRFSLDGEKYVLAKNNGPNHLHGGLEGYDKKIWNIDEAAEKNTLVLSYTSKDGEEGYPGNLQVEVTYCLTEENELEISYEATTDKKTVVNLTNHSYFNLSGNFSKEILDHEVKINADEFLPVDETMIPLGDAKSVAGTPFDFHDHTALGAKIEEKNDQLERANGYDHSFIINGDGMRFAASAIHPESGRKLEVFTTEPGMQLYTGNWLDGTLPISGNGYYQKRSGFCFETQHYPDSPNHKNFPSVVLEPGQIYSSKTIFKFSVEE